jgi:hypothetical protein
MKGQSELLIERAIAQARREADSLYLLIGSANTEVLKSRGEREREYVFLLMAFLSTLQCGKTFKQRLEDLRLALLLFIKTVIVLDTAIAQVVTEHFSGQSVLFRDSEVKLQEQLQMAETLSKHYNLLARENHVAHIDLEDLRNGLHPESDRTISDWVSLGRVKTLQLFGTTEEVHAEIERNFLLNTQAPGANL